MKKTQALLIILAIGLTSALTGFIFSLFEHRDKISEQPVPIKSQREVMYYRNPMHPDVTSPVPMKDEMGMDYVPVYAKEASAKASAGTHISPERQQLIGLKKEKIQKMKLAHEILAAGKIAYDPALFTAQQEYLVALGTRKKIYSYSTPLLKKQVQGLVGAAQKRLNLLGMTEQEIRELTKRGRPQESLILPANEDKAWAYLAVYEFEIGLIKEGAAVKIEVAAFPGESFMGKVVAITPVLDAATRSGQVRVEIKDTAHKFKPEMYVNAAILVDLGEKLALPESAVLDTGVRKIVYIVKDGDVLEAREVSLGQKAQGYYEVIDGLKEGDMVVTSGNFLVDSESKLTGA
ncbi:MAG: efflux RND transporter periplasmic adaptor subunit [Candidatus Omnitrophica bacterium]|nr:efflux RND transporter periplasmic adaptor subunit [Candidatus Omnitrophota bacterium]